MSLMIVIFMQGSTKVSKKIETEKYRQLFVVQKLIKINKQNAVNIVYNHFKRTMQMKKMIIMGVLLLCTLFAQAQVGGITISNGTSQNQAFRGVFLRKSLLPDVLLAVKEGTVWLSEKPGGEESGYYGVQTNNGIFYNGKKEKVKTNQMTDVGDGWFFYDFGKDLYIFRIGLTCNLENIRLLPSEHAGNSPTNNETQNRDDTPPFVKLNPQCPSLESDGWTLAKTEKGDDNTLYTYTKEVDDEERSVWIKKFENGDFTTNYSPVAKKTDINGNISLLDGNIEQVISPKGWVLQTKRERKRESTYYYESAILYIPNGSNGEYKATKKIRVEEKDCWSYSYGGNLLQEGFLIGDRLYYEDPQKPMTFIPFMQKFNGKLFYASQRDTIIDVTSSEDSLVVRFKNGDRYKKVIARNIYDTYYVADLHRNNGIVKMRKNDRWPIFTRDDGATIRVHAVYLPIGQSKGHDSRVEYMEPHGLGNGNDICIMYAVDTIIPDGDLKKPDGTYGIVDIDAGHDQAYWDANPTEYERSKMAEKAQKAKEEAEEAAKRNSYIKKYGFYPGDYNSIKDVLKPGRPIAAIKEYYAVCSLIRDDGASQQYRVTYNWSSTRTYNAYVTVRNGKIVSVSFP